MRPDADELLSLLAVAHQNLDQLDRLSPQERRRVCASGAPLQHLPLGPTELLAGTPAPRHLRLVR